MRYYTDWHPVSSIQNKEGKPKNVSKNSQNRDTINMNEDDTISNGLAEVPANNINEHLTYPVSSSFIHEASRKGKDSETSPVHNKRMHRSGANISEDSRNDSSAAASLNNTNYTSNFDEPRRMPNKYSRQKLNSVIDKSDVDGTFAEVYVNESKNRATGPFLQNTIPSDVVSKIRADAKNRNEKLAETFVPFDGRRKRTVTERSQRVRRSLDKKSDYVGFVEQVSSPSEKLYRHPNLSYEDQQKQLNGTYRAKGPLYGSVTSKLLPNESHSSSPSTIESSTRVSNAYNCTSIFSNCNDTDDENLQMHHANVTRQRVTEKYDREDGGEEEAELQKEEESKSVKDLKDVRDDESVDGWKGTIGDTSRLQPSVDLKRRRDKGYINIRDHQKSVENATASDANSDYDPNKIPYVEVPDYSDIREESLDAEDRKASEKEAKGKKVDSSVSADPGISKGLKQLSESSRSDAESKKGTAEEKLRSAGRNTDEESDSDVPSLKKPSYVDTSDKSITEDFSKDTKANLGVKDNSRPANFELRGNPEVSSNFGEFEPSKNDELEGKKEGKPASNKNNLSNSGLKEGEESSEEASKENGESQEASEEAERQGDYSERQLGPIIFDINEYRKPFDLDEFLKDDPIMKKLKLLGKETRAKYGQNGKRVPGDFNESESDNSFREQANGPAGSTEQRDTFDDLPKSHLSGDFTNTFAKTLAMASINGYDIGEKQDKEDGGGRNWANFATTDGSVRDNKRERNKIDKDAESVEDFAMKEGRDDQDNYEMQGKVQKDMKGRGDSAEGDLKIHFVQNASNKVNKDTKNRETNNKDSSDEDFLRFVFRENEKQDPPSEKEFLVKYFTEDVIKQLPQDTNSDAGRRRKDKERKEDMYNALATILSKKDRVSRLHEDINERIKAEGGEPMFYKTSWFLNYDSPRSRADMEAEERRK